MARVTLIVNPAAGAGIHRMREAERAADTLRTLGHRVSVLQTTSPGSGGEQAGSACEAGADIVFACGGDGTVHDVLQGMVAQTHAAMGILPLGSANALARHLRLPHDPAEAARLQMHWAPRTVPVGEVRCHIDGGEIARFFCVMAGAGPDGALVYRMLATGKHSLGRLSYYLRAARLFASTSFPAFELTYEDERSGAAHRERVVSAMAVRVGDLGGLFSPLVRGGQLDQPFLTLSLARTPAHASLPAWFAMSWARLHRFNSLAPTVAATSFHAGAADGVPVHVQADGEWLGYTPMSVRLVPDALRLLMPR